MANEHSAYSPLFGYLGAAAAPIFASFGAAIATGKCVAALAQHDAKNRGTLICKSLIVIAVGGVLFVLYGLIAAMVLKGKVVPASSGYTLEHGAAHLAAGLTCGLCALAGGIAIGIMGDAALRTSTTQQHQSSQEQHHQPQHFIGMILVLIFGNLIGVLGLLVALILSTA